MNARSVIQFFKSKTGKFLIFLVVGALALIFVNRKREESPAGKKQAEAMAKSTLVAATVADSGQTKEEGFTVTKEMKPARPLYPAPTATPTPTPAEVVASKSGTAENGKGEATTAAAASKCAAIKIFAAEPKQVPMPDILPNEAYAPFGRLIQCELTITVDSSSMDTPIVGLVTHDLWWKNAKGEKKLIIPANSEVHGVARNDRVRERIASSGSWVVVLAEGTDYPAGTELLLNGLALDMQVMDGKFDITDGSAGLKGRVLTNTSTADEVKLFAASFLSGASKGMVKTQTGWGGMQEVVGGFQTAGAMATGNVIDQYAKTLMETIQRDGWYVRVPAGKQFYLYVRQDILLRKAKLGASLAMPLPKDKPADGEPLALLSSGGKTDAERVIEAQQRQQTLIETLRGKSTQPPLTNQ